MTKERRHKKEYAAELVRIAENDLIAAKTLASNKQVRVETVFFQLQQVTEKSLKALIVASGKAVPLVHDIALLMDRLASVHSFPDELKELTDFASVRRYEEGTFEVSFAEVDAAITSVEKALALCKSMVAKLLKGKSAP